MKKLIAIIITAILLCSCAPSEQPSENARFTFAPISDCNLFPFYFTDGNGSLFRCDNGNISETQKNVRYFSGGTDESFIRYFKSDDRIVFASDVTLSSGKAVCKLYEQKGSEKAQLVQENVQLDSLRSTQGGNVLFKDGSGTLFLKTAKSLFTVENNVNCAEFADEETVLYISNGNSVYSYVSGSKTYLTDGEDIIEKQGGAYVIKDVHLVQRRAFSLQVGTCLAYEEGEFCCEVESVPVSSLKDEVLSGCLLSFDETSSKARYKLIDIRNGAFTVAENVLDGKTVSEGVFAYECEENSSTVTYIYNGETLQNVGDIPLNSINSVNGNLYTYFNGNIVSLKSGQQIFSDISVAKFGDNYILASIDGKMPYTATLLTAKSSYQIKNLSLMQGELCGNAFYFYAEKSCDLMRFDMQTLAVTALVAETDVSVGILADGNYAFASKNGNLFLSGDSLSLDTGIKITAFIK